MPTIEQKIGRPLGLSGISGADNLNQLLGREPLNTSTNEPEVQSPSNMPSETQDVGNVPYSTNTNFQEHEFMRSNLRPKNPNINPNIRTTTKSYGTAKFGEYQDPWSNASRSPWGIYGTDRPNAAEGIWGDYQARQRSVMGTVPGAFRGMEQIGDDRLNQYSNVMFNPNVKSDIGLNDMYENFYNQQGII